MEMESARARARACPLSLPSQMQSNIPWAGLVRSPVLSAVTVTPVAVRLSRRPLHYTDRRLLLLRRRAPCRGSEGRRCRCRRRR